MLELVLILGSGNNQIGNHSEIGEVESALVGLAVIPDDAAAVGSKHHRQVLQTDIVDNLVEGSLQESRVDSDNRNIALRGKSGGKSDRVLLCDADIEDAPRELGLNDIQAISFRHGRRNHD